MVCMIGKMRNLVRTGGKGLNFRPIPFELIEEYPEWKYLADKLR